MLDFTIVTTPFKLSGRADLSIGKGDGEDIRLKIDNDAFDVSRVILYRLHGHLIFSFDLSHCSLWLVFKQWIIRSERDEPFVLPPRLLKLVPC